MGYARQQARDLRHEAIRLAAMGLMTLAKERKEQADLFERIADDAAAAEHDQQSEAR